MTPAQFNQLSRELTQFVRHDAHVILATEAEKHFKHSFQKGEEGFTDDHLEKWPDINEKTKARKRRKNGSLPPILTDTGNLGDSLTGRPTSEGAVVSTDVPYAKRHNEGENGMKKRQFMGPSSVMEGHIQTELDKGITRIVNKYTHL